jgi:saccharopine dehydrogenase-like NADP-dependent oxidoreductase
MRSFAELDTVNLYVGALPVHISNGLQYALTWFTDGLINGYDNACLAIENNALVTL